MALLKAKYGRDPVTGRALLSDGTVRAPKVARTPAQKISAALAVIAKAMYATIIHFVSRVPALRNLQSGMENLGRYVRAARTLGTPEAIAAERARLERALQTLDDRGRIAMEYLPKAEATLAVVKATFGKVSQAIQGIAEAAGENPTDSQVATVTAIVDGMLSDSDREAIRLANEGKNPFEAYAEDSDDTDDTDPE